MMEESDNFPLGVLGYVVVNAEGRVICAQGQSLSHAKSCATSWRRQSQPTAVVAMLVEVNGG